MADSSLFQEMPEFLGAPCSSFFVGTKMKKYFCLLFAIPFLLFVSSTPVYAHWTVKSDNLLPQWFKYALFLLAGIHLLLLFNGLWLRAQVKKKTADLSLANDELKRSRENYHSLYNNAQAGILRSRIGDGKVLECNKMMAEMLGYESPEQCLDECFMPNHLVDPEFRKTTVDYLRCHMLAAELETVITRCNGEKIYIRFSARLYPKEEFIEMVCTDITEYRQSTISLAKREEELLAVYHGAPGLMLVVDGQNRICKANKAAQEFCLYSEVEMLGKRLGEFFGCTYATAVDCGTHPACENCLLRLTVLEAVDKGETIRRKEATLMQNSDNGVWMRHLLISVSPLNQGQSLHTLICLEDITDIKNAHSALIESEERFRTLFDRACDAIFLIDSSGRFQDVNQQACDSLGYSRAELLRMKVSDVDAFMSETDLIECQRKIERGEFPPTLESRHRCKNGQVIEVEVSCTSPIILQDESFTIAIARDITLRKNAARELLASESRYTALYTQFNALLNAISDPLILFSSEMKTIWANAAYEELHSLSDGQKDSQLTANVLKTPVSQCFLTGKVVEDVLSTADKRMWGVKVFPLAENGGGSPLALVIAVDITEKMQLREEAHRASRLASLGELAAGIAHEINNPNAVILLNTAIIKEAFADAEEILNAYFKEHGDFSLAEIDYSEMRSELPLLIDRVKDSAERIKRIVDDLKNFIRDEKRTFDEMVDVNKVVTDGVRLLGNMIKKSTSNFSVQLEADLPAINGDAQKLVQVLVNLVHNACQALTDTSQAIIVETRFDRQAHNLILSVTDQGHGIEKNQLPRLFEPFYTTKRSTGGTGLGLSVSHRILKEHGAQMTVESESGKGSIFKVVIPVGGEEGSS